MKKIECKVEKAKKECQCDDCKMRRGFEIQLAMIKFQQEVWKTISDSINSSSMSS